jgi:hypothetical protein
VLEINGRHARAIALVGRGPARRPHAQHSANQSAADDDKQRTNKKICGRHECEGRFTNTSQIHDGDDSKYAEAQRQSMRLLGRNRGDQCAYTCRDAYCGGEKVIGQQGRGGQKARRCPEIEAGDCVRAAHAGIRCNRLTI